MLNEKHKRINDLQRLNTFFMRRAEELAESADQMADRNLHLKAELRQF